MLKMLKYSIIGICIFAVVFTFMPTGTSNAAVVEGYTNTLKHYDPTQGHLVGSYQQLMDLANTQSLLSDDEADELGLKISQMAIEIANTLGDGAWAPSGKAWTGQTTRWGQSQFKYTISTTADYSPFSTLKANIEAMRKDSSKTCGISCIAAATYCWQYYMQDIPNIYQTGCSYAMGKTPYGEVATGDGTIEYVIAHAEPGDLIFFTANNDTHNAYATARYPNYKYGSWSHAELYVGPYKDEGNGVEIEHAMVGSNEPGNGTNWNIKAVATHNGRKVYLVKLKDWARHMGLDTEKYNIGTGDTELPDDPNAEPT